MQCSIRPDRDRYCGNVKMKTINNYKNPYQKEPNLDIIVDQLALRLQDIKEQGAPPTGMPACSVEQTEAVRRYYAAFPALKKDETSPLQYCLPPPAWCRKPENVNMQNNLITKDWKKLPCKERRNSYQGQRKNKKRCNAYSRSFESKDLPEWVTHEGIWDMEAQDPVREFIRAIALDEGYGTAENTVTDDMHMEPKARAVPQWDDGLELGEWVIAELADEPPPRPLSPSEEELYARFEAKFDRSIEALWARDQNTPDDDYQELPIDFAELLSSPSDGMFGPPPAPRFAPSPPSPPAPSSLPSLGSLGDAVWACEAPPSPALHDRLRPLYLASPPPPPELESFALFDGDELYEALSTVADTMRSLTVINHSRDTSGFCEVPPRKRGPRPPLSPPPRRPDPEPEREDLLTAARTHFRPIEREPEAEAPRYADGDTFDIRGTPDTIEYRRSPSGSSYIGTGRYLECRGAPRGLRFAVRQSDAGVQTDGSPACDECAGAAKKMRPAGAVACLCTGSISAPSPPAADEMSRDWEELLADISAAHEQYAAAPAVEEEGGCDRKRRHSAALRCARHCAHPHARFLPCAALDRPLTR